MRMQIQSKDSTRIVNINRRKAIREHCLNCSNWNTAEAKDCQHTDCPLYPYRLGQGPQDSKARAKAIRDYCLWCMSGSAKEVSKCIIKTCPLFPYRNASVDKAVEISPTGARKGHIEVISEPKMLRAVG